MSERLFNKDDGKTCTTIKSEVNGDGRINPKRFTGQPEVGFQGIEIRVHHMGAESTASQREGLRRVLQAMIEDLDNDYHFLYQFHLATQSVIEIDFGNGGGKPVGLFVERNGDEVTTVEISVNGSPRIQRWKGVQATRDTGYVGLHGLMTHIAANDDGKCDHSLPVRTYWDGDEEALVRLIETAKYPVYRATNAACDAAEKLESASFVNRVASNIALPYEVRIAAVHAVTDREILMKFVEDMHHSTWSLDKPHTARRRAIAVYSRIVELGWQHLVDDLDGVRQLFGANTPEERAMLEELARHIEERRAKA